MNQVPADQVIGKQILRFDSVTSTNDIARQLALRQADEGTVVTAAEQTLGRGSRGRSWVSPPGVNLLVSVILRPSISLQRVSELAFVASLAIANCLTEMTGLQAKVKWPNDVRLGDKKVAGVLIEVASEGSGEPLTAILGVGINLNWDPMPTELIETATSVLMTTGNQTDLSDALVRFLAALDETYREYIDDGFETILAKWRILDCVIGTDIAVCRDGETVCGLAEGFDSDGTLLLRTLDGDIERVSATGLIVT